MRAQDFPGWLAAIAGLSAEQRGEAVLALAKAGEGAAAPEDLAAPSPGKRRAKRTEDALERRALSGWKAGAARIARVARSSAGAARTGCCDSAARVADARSMR